MPGEGQNGRCLHLRRPLLEQLSCKSLSVEFSFSDAPAEIASRRAGLLKDHEGEITGVAPLSHSYHSAVRDHRGAGIPSRDIKARGAEAEEGAGSLPGGAPRGRGRESSGGRCGAGGSGGRVGASAASSVEARRERHTEK
eukprot:scaffold2069_cov254-Pinguiococcus_pyrenoidosus.AAC.3